MKPFYLAAILLLVTTAVYGQFSSYDTTENNTYLSSGTFTLNSDNNVMQIGGRVSGYYEDRFLKSGITNKKHNGFAFKDVDLDILGKTSGKFVYEVQLSLLDIVSAASVANSATSATVQAASNINPNPDNNGFKAAYIAYEGKKLPFHVKFGYDKLPYSMGSLNDVYSTPFWSHPNLVGGDMFSRRDLGVTLYRSFWEKRVNVYGGVYSGLGENVFEYGGDASGKPEYVGRIDVSYPKRYKYDLIDAEVSPVPVFRVGINARYADKTQPAGYSIYTDAPDAPGSYGLRIADGKRMAYGGDFTFKYMGFSANLEGHILELRPTDNSNPLYEATPAAFNKGYVKAGGYVGGVNYNWSAIHSVFAVSFEDINWNDLIKGEEQWLYFGYAYNVVGFNSVFKVQYYLPVKEDAAQDPLKYTGQIRVGYQIVF